MFPVNFDFVNGKMTTVRELTAIGSSHVQYFTTLLMFINLFSFAGMVVLASHYAGKRLSVAVKLRPSILAENSREWRG